MEKTRSYSGLFIILPDKEDTLDQVLEGIKSIIKENSGEVLNEKPMGKRKLAYPIRKQEEGLYHEIKFKALPEKIGNINRRFHINSDILRSIVNKQD